MASKRTHYTRAHLDPNLAIIVDDLDRIIRKPKRVETKGSSSQLIKANSLPKELSSLEDIQFDLSFEISLFHTKSKNSIHDTVIDPNFIQFIESKKVRIHLDLDQHVLDTFDKLEDLTSTLIRHIDEAYLQQSVELAILITVTPEISTESSKTVNRASFTTTSPITSTTIHSPKPFIPQLALQSNISSSSSSYIAISSASSSTTTLSPSQTKALAMVDKYAPLVLPAQLHAMPQDYQSKIFLFDATSQYTAQHHLNKMIDYFELHEIDESDVKMRLFAQTLAGDFKKWFKGLPANHITDLAVFHRLFINRWERNKNPLQILSEYENIRRAQNESVKDYFTRFNSIYNAIPANIKPPPDLALINFSDGFNTDMSYQLRERNPETLGQMKSNVVSVETNLLAKRDRMRNEKRVTIKEEPSTSEGKIDSLAKSVERIMDRLENMERKSQWENQQGSQIRKPNFRKNPNTGKTRDVIPNQQIRPHFQENYAEGSQNHEEEENTQINLLGIKNKDVVFLT